MAPTPMMRLKVRVRIAPRCYHRTPCGPGLLALALALAPVASAAPVAEAWVRSPADLDADDVLVRTGEVRAGPDGPEERVLSADLEALARLGLDVRELRADHRRGPPPAGYREPDEGDAVLADLAQRSDRAGLVRLGTSVQGRPLEALWLGVVPGGGARSVRVLGAHHGDEPISSEVVLALAERLVAGDGEDVRVTGLLDGATVWVVPFVNPDGLVEGSRFNATGVDLNRNYDLEWRADAALVGQTPFSEPETRAIRALADLERATLGLTLHSGATNLGWPWNHTAQDPADAAAFEAIARLYASDCTTPGFWTTQGGDWFTSNGDLDDWSYGRHGDVDLTLEVSLLHAPPEDGIDTVLDQHLDAILAVLALAPGVSGRVVDAANGLPVEATLALDDGMPFGADASTGAFHRVALPGAATLAVSAPGYAPVEVDAGVDTVIALEPAGLAEGRLSPAVLRWPARIELPGDPARPARWVRPGADAFSTDGAPALDPGALAPGWWTVELGDGRVLPRALFVDGPEPGVALDRWTVSGDLACVVGTGFAHGARAWAVWGRERVPVELPVASFDDRELCLAVDEVPRDADPDVAIWTSGARLGIDHLWEPRVIGDPATAERLIPVGSCACGPIPGHRDGFALSIVFVGWLTARSRRRGGRDAAAPGPVGLRR